MNPHRQPAHTLLRALALGLCIPLAACAPSYDLDGTWTGTLQGCDEPDGDGLALRLDVLLDAAILTSSDLLVDGDPDCQSPGQPVEDPGSVIEGSFPITCGEFDHTFAVSLAVEPALTGDLFATGPVEWTIVEGDSTTTLRCDLELFKN